MKTKFAVFTLSLLMVLTMATGAFAQGVFTVSGGIEPRGRMNGHAEEAGGITLFLNSGGIDADDEGTVVIDYGVPITNAVGVDSDDTDPLIDNNIAVNICAVTRQEGGTGSPVDVDGSTITVTVDGATCTGEESINVEGVLLSLVGSGASNIMATVTTTGDVRLPGGAGNRVTVIDSVVDPLTDDNVTVGQKMTLTRHTGEPSVAQFHLVITEAHVDSFDGGQLNLKFSGIPDGVEVTALDAWVTTKEIFDDDDEATMTAAAMNQVPVSITNMMGSRAGADADEDGEATVFLQTANRIPLTPEDTTTETTIPEIPQGGVLTPGVDVVVVRGSIDGTKAKDLLPIDLTIQVAVDLGPIGDDDDENPLIPRFASDRTTAMTVIDSTSAQTTLKVPFAVDNGTYDTGIGVANMSDAQAGAIMVDFYVGATEPMSYKTEAGSPGLGLNVNGMLEPGGTYSVLLSELFDGNPGNGYLIITTDFTGGDGNIFISDFSGFSATGIVRIDRE